MHATRFPRRASLPLLFLGLLCIADCNSGGGGSESVTIGYAGDASAYGILIRSGDLQARTQVAASDPPCTMSPPAVAAGCNGSVETSEQGLRLTLRGCFLETGDALFNCELSSGQAAQLRSDATVTAGCGCQATCPAAPAISVCDANTGDCQAADTSAAEKTQVVSTTIRPTAETTCSTCCDVDTAPYTNAVLTSAQPLTEIEVRLTVNQDCQISDADCEVEDFFAWGETSIGAVSAATQRYCLASVNPIDNVITLPLLRCREGTISAATVVRAFGADFEPLADLRALEIGMEME